MRNAVGYGLLLIAQLCFGQRSAPAIQEPTATFHSQNLGLDFVYPSGFVNKPTDDASANSDGKSAGGKKTCVSSPIAAMDMRKNFNMIFVKRVDGACMGKEITAADWSKIASNFLQLLLNDFGHAGVTSATDYEIGSHMASVVSGTVTLESVKPAGTVISGAGTCVVAGRDLACFAFLSDDCPTLAALSASTVKFTDGVATPVIPAKLVPGCGPQS